MLQNLADSARVQQVERCNDTDVNANIEEGYDYRWHAYEPHFLSMDRMDSIYQILMRERYIPYTIVSSLSGILWEWLVMPQRFSNTSVHKCKNLAYVDSIATSTSVFPSIALLRANTSSK